MAIVRQLRNRYFFALDVVLLVTAVVLSYVLRLDTFSFDLLGFGFLFFTGVVIVINPLLFYLFGIYSRYWVYASVEELLLLSGATTLGIAISGSISLVGTWIIPYMMVFSLRSAQNGTVLERSINAGEQVEPGKELFLISDLSEVWVWANIKEEELLQVTSLKDTIVAEIQVPGLGSKTYRGLIDVVSGKINEQTRSARARISVGNPDGLLRPGMFVNIRLLLPGTQQTFFVPQVAVLADEGRQFVFVHKEGDYWIRRPVTTGERFNDQVAIIKGLTPGQKIIADGSFMLKSAVLREKMGAGCAD